MKRPIERIGFNGLRKAVVLVNKVKDSNEGKLLGKPGLKEMAIIVIEQDIKYDDRTN